MNRFLLTAILIAVCAFPCAAQTKDVVEEVEAKLTDLRIAARHADERAEDVEILRRLLNKALGLPDRAEVWVDRRVSQGLGISLSDGRFTPGETERKGVSPVGPFDGVYLKGAGVVYTLRVPAGAELTFDPHTQKVGLGSGCNHCHQGITPNTNSHFISFSHSNFRGDCSNCHRPEMPSVAAKSLTEWEQAKMALRGEKPTVAEPKKAEKPRGVICEPGTLVEQLTAQLSANAKNVRHLGEKESITLVVTFDALPGGKPAAGSPAKLGLTPDEVQALTLGDLHMKQGKHAQAVEEYLKGLYPRFRFDGPIGFAVPPNTSHVDAEAAVREMTGSIRATYKSLAAAYLALGHLEDAKQALDKATTVRVELGTPSTGDRPKTVGPAKLMVSVAKADLASTKDVAAFKKVVRVERVNFPAAMEKTTK